MLRSMNLMTMRRVGGTFLEVTPNQLRRLADAADEALKRGSHEAMEISDNFVLLFRSDYVDTTATIMESEPPTPFDG